MSGDACSHDHGHLHDHHGGLDFLQSRAYRRVLAIAMALNLGMFAIEVVAGFTARSVSLQADALDFLGDGANYALSLAVLGRALHWRARASLVKAACMGAFGIFVLGNALHNALLQPIPVAVTMGAVGALALLVNGGVALMLYRFRSGDSNMRSVWLCTRNDALGNVAVMLAALGVFGTGTVWPDLAVASVMASLALSSAFQVLRHAGSELRPGASQHHAH